MSGNNPFLSGNDEITQEILRLRSQLESAQNELMALQAKTGVRIEPPHVHSAVPSLVEALQRHRAQYLPLYNDPTFRAGYGAGLQAAEQLAYEEEARHGS